MGKPANIILEGVVGSKAYGLDTKSSDTDIKGVYILPLKNILSVNFNPQKTTLDHTDPDWVYHEIGKFIKLVAGGNPTVTELLFLEEYTELNEIGQLLVKNRDIFLSTKNVMNAYRGYAFAQAKKLSARQKEGLEGYDSSVKNRFAKHTRHLARLLWQAEELITTGKVTLRLSPERRDFAFELGRKSPSEVVDYFIEEDKRVAALEPKSVLPSTPNWREIDELLYDIRTFYEI